MVTDRVVSKGTPIGLGGGAVDAGAPNVVARTGGERTWLGAVGGVVDGTTVKN